MFWERRQNLSAIISHVITNFQNMEKIDKSASVSIHKTKSWDLCKITDEFAKVSSSLHVPGELLRL
jgi:hypothetical protein